MRAASGGHADMVKLLLSNGADPMLTGPQGYNALHFATDTGIADLLLRAGVDINVRNDSESTPLMRAAAEGNLPMLQKLIAAGADVHARDNEERTALWSAASAGHSAAIQCLIDAGADCNSANNVAYTPLIAA